MLKQKRSKFSRMRGSMTHGGGHKKKRRGAGHRGGVGLSGTGARGDAQKAGLLANSKNFMKKYTAVHGIKMKDLKKSLLKKDYFGKRGFNSIKKKSKNTISLREIEENFDKLVELGLIIKEKDGFVFDANVGKYDKILGKSKFSKKLKVICSEISDSAKQKILDAGGEVIVKENSESKN